jgi:hypothetical protein
VSLGTRKTDSVLAFPAVLFSYFTTNIRSCVWNPTTRIVMTIHHRAQLELIIRDWNYCSYAILLQLSLDSLQRNLLVMCSRISNPFKRLRLSDIHLRTYQFILSITAILVVSTILKRWQRARNSLLSRGRVELILR